jgi:sec-independent protein translocase protein TatC
MFARRRPKTQFERAADGSMSLMDHVRELRDRLFRAAIAVVLGFCVGMVFSERALGLLQRPYCDLMRDTATRHAGHPLDAAWQCPFIQLEVTSTFVLRMKIALWLGLLIAAPFWLYQLWAFIAPGLHRHERRWAYAFAAVAAPLFAVGAVAAFFVVSKGLEFLLQFNGPDVTVQLEITKYVDFVTGLMLLFGGAFEFPLIIVMFIHAGLATAKRLLGWWRIAVFLMFLFAAVATPTADPFGMTFLALAMSALYFGAVGFAFVNDRRRSRAARYQNLADDETSPLGPMAGEEAIDEADPIPLDDPVVATAPVAAPRR